MHEKVHIGTQPSNAERDAPGLGLIGRMEPNDITRYCVVRSDHGRHNRKRPFKGLRV